jgi:cytochrome c
MQTNRRLKISFLVCVISLAMITMTTTIPTVSAAPDVAAIYTAKCAKCHGSDGRGVEKYKKKGVKDFTDAQWQKTRSDAQFTASVSNGKGEVMPAWKAKLSAEEIKSLVGFVRAFKK